MQVGQSQESILADLAARVTRIGLGKVHLYKDDGFVPDENSVLADFNAHEADYTGYAAGGVALSAGLGPYAGGPNQYAESYPTIAFQPSGGPITANTIRGVYVETVAGGHVDSFFIFDTAWVMAMVLDIILFDTKLIAQNPLIPQPDPA